MLGRFLVSGGIQGERMNTRMTMDELAGLVPLPEWISVACAAEILGGGSERERELIRLVIDANIASCSHSSLQLLQAERTVHATGHRELLPDLRPDTDPTTVLIDSEDVVWRWCVDLESLFLNSGDKKLPPRDKVEARLTALKARSIELPTGGKPLPLDGTDSGTAPASRWPWGDHHTKALGHLEAAALRFWVNYDPTDPSTAPTNGQVSEWLRKERKVSKTLGEAMASILRLDGLKTGPRT